MVITNENIKIEKTYLVDYENDIKCFVTIVNNKLNNYHFSSNKFKKSLTYIKDINPFINSIWPEHTDMINDLSPKLTLEQIHNFNDFDNLYVIGGGIDGTLRDRNGKILSTLIKLNSEFCMVYLKNVNDIDSANSFVNRCKDIKCVKSSSVLEIPYYNQDYGTHTVELYIHLNDDEHEKMLEEVSPKYIDDLCKKWILNYIKLY